MGREGLVFVVWVAAWSGVATAVAPTAAPPRTPGGVSKLCSEWLREGEGGAAAVLMSPIKNTKNNTSGSKSAPTSTAGPPNTNNNNRSSATTSTRLRRIAVLIRGEARSLPLAASWGAFRRYVVDALRATRPVDVFAWVKTGLTYAAQPAVVCRALEAAGAGPDQATVEREPNRTESDGRIATAKAACGPKVGCPKRSLNHQIFNIEHAFLFFLRSLRPRGLSMKDFDWILDVRADLRWVDDPRWEAIIAKSSQPAPKIAMHASGGRHPEYGADVVRLIPAATAQHAMTFDLEGRCKTAHSWCVAEDYFRYVAQQNLGMWRCGYPATIRRDTFDPKWDGEFCDALVKSPNHKGLALAECRRRVRASRFW